MPVFTSRIAADALMFTANRVALSSPSVRRGSNRLLLPLLDGWLNRAGFERPRNFREQNGAQNSTPDVPTRLTWAG